MSSCDVVYLPFYLKENDWNECCGITSGTLTLSHGRGTISPHAVNTLEVQHKVRAAYGFDLIIDLSNL